MRTDWQPPSEPRCGRHSTLRNGRQDRSRAFLLKTEPHDWKSTPEKDMRFRAAGQGCIIPEQYVGVCRVVGRARRRSHARTPPPFWNPSRSICIRSHRSQEYEAAARSDAEKGSLRDNPHFLVAGHDFCVFAIFLSSSVRLWYFRNLERSPRNDLSRLSLIIHQSRGSGLAIGRG